MAGRRRTIACGGARSALRVPLLVTLQGDDVFVESLPEPYRSRVLSELRRLAAAADGFLVHSQYYAEFMAEYLGIPEEVRRRAPSADIQTSTKVRMSKAPPAPTP